MSSTKLSQLKQLLLRAAVGDRQGGVPPLRAREGLTNCPRLVLPRTNSTRVFVVCKQRMLLLQLVVYRERTTPRKGTSAPACEPGHSYVLCHKNSTKPSFLLSLRIPNTWVSLESLQPQLYCTAGFCLGQKSQQMLAINSAFLCFLTKSFLWKIFLVVLALS